VFSDVCFRGGAGRHRSHRAMHRPRTPGPGRPRQMARRRRSRSTASRDAGVLTPQERENELQTDKTRRAKHLAKSAVAVVKRAVRQPP
jgi:hypothetical protein